MGSRETPGWTGSEEKHPNRTDGSSEVSFSARVLWVFFYYFCNFFFISVVLPIGTYQKANWLRLPPAHAARSPDRGGARQPMLMRFWQQSSCVSGVILLCLQLGSVLALGWMNGTNSHSRRSSCQRESTQFYFQWPHTQSFASLMENSQLLQSRICFCSKNYCGYFTKRGFMNVSFSALVHILFIYWA